jgi:hypothetical protein
MHSGVRAELARLHKLLSAELHTGDGSDDAPRHGRNESNRRGESNRGESNRGESNRGESSSNPPAQRSNPPAQGQGAVSQAQRN